MEKDTDVLEFDFPDYEEPYPPFPDVRVADFDKEESYGRNRDIAYRLYADEFKEKERRAKKLRKAERKKHKRASRSRKRPLRRILSVIALFIAVESVLLFMSVGIPLIRDSIEPAPDVPEHSRHVFGSSDNYIAPDPLPKPFERTESGAAVYSDDVMSFMFTPASDTASDNTAVFDVTVRNLTNEVYWVMPDSFYLTFMTMDETLNKHIIYYSSDRELEYKTYTDGGSATAALLFDSSGECRFTLSFDISEMNGYERHTDILQIGYDRERFLSDYVENTSDSFEVYLKAPYYPN